MNRIFAAAVAAAFALLVWAPRAEAGPITITGSTSGCFGAGCTNFSLNPTDLTYELTFIGTTFTTSTDPSGNTAVGIGTFDRGNVNIGNPPPASLPFTLQVSFTVPVGINGSPSSFTAFITGQAASLYDVNLDNTFRTFTYSNPAGSGSFDFGVLDIFDIQNNSSGHVVTGVIQTAPFTSDAGTAAVPEPGTLVLLATGLVAAGFRLRKSMRKS